MRILVVNSNTTRAVTDMIAAEARRVAAPDLEIEAVTAPFGPASIQTRAHAAVAAHATLEAFQTRSAGFDAGIVACFIDPGLAAVREAMPYPVVGIGEAAYLTACTRGSRFSVLTLGSSMLQPIREEVARHGLASRLASVHGLPVGVVAAAGDQAALLQPMRALIDRAVNDDGAEVVVLGGAALAGLIPKLGDAPVPLLDGVACATGLARSLAAMNQSLKDRTQSDG
ncbi:MAG: aspartate/glutamate racemase family protein [Alphaproteobacteria bacterium]